MFPFPFTLNGIWSWWKFSFRFSEPNGIPFGSKLKGKLSQRSYPIQCERKWKYSFLSAAICKFPQRSGVQLLRTTFFSSSKLSDTVFFSSNVSILWMHCGGGGMKREKFATIMFRILWKIFSRKSFCTNNGGDIAQRQFRDYYECPLVIFLISWGIFELFLSYTWVRREENVQKCVQYYGYCNVGSCTIQHTFSFWNGGFRIFGYPNQT